MSTRYLIHSIMTGFASPRGRSILLFLYYLAIIAGLILMYGNGNFTTPKFIYQEF